jgi:CRISPR/Cas system CMR subunit Cmr6 (Cas7 group RAMP superfamily)
MANFELEIKTPVHIGSGETWSSFSDFVAVDKNVYILDSNKIFDTLLEIPNAVDGYLDIVKGNGNDKTNIKFILRDYFEQDNIENSLTKDFIDKYTKKQYKLEKLDNNIDVERLITSSNRAYIPGSSIKGAIRTALIHKYNERNKGKEEKAFREYPFGRYASDEFKFLQVGDSAFVNQENLSLEKISLEYIYGEGDAGEIISECIAKGKLRFKIKTTGENSRHYFLKPESEKELLKEVGKFYLNRLNKEIGVFKKLKKEEGFQYDCILNKYQQIKNSLKADEYLIRLGKYKVDYDQSLLDLIGEEDALKIVNNKKREEPLTSMDKYPITRKIIKDIDDTPINVCGWAVIREVEK